MDPLALAFLAESGVPSPQEVKLETGGLSGALLVPGAKHPEGGGSSSLCHLCWAVGSVGSVMELWEGLSVVDPVVWAVGQCLVPTVVILEVSLSKLSFLDFFCLLCFGF